jgi:serine/threonine-protein kinase
MVTDFGIARAIEAGSRLTVTGIAVGTPAYMSPEQAMGEREVDGRSDIYSLGVVAYQMLTGRLPFVGSNPMALLLKHVNERPRPIAELRPDAPKAMREAIERALMKDREDRWATAGAFRDALATDEAPVAPWRSDHREPVRYTSPRRGSPVADNRMILSGTPGGPVLSATRSGKPIVMEPEHLASLTPAQREDLRLWHGRVNLFDRIKTMRRYAWFSAALMFASLGGLAGVEDVPPLVLGPLIPLYMLVKTWKRGKSLRENGLKLRRVLLLPRAKWVLPAPPPMPTESQLSKLAPTEVLDGPDGPAIRRAAADRMAIMDMVAKLPKQDRAMLPDLDATAKALVERVAQLAQMLYRLNESIDWRLVDELDDRIANARRQGDSPEGARRLGLLERQRETLQGLVQRRTELMRQLESAGLALGSLRLDLVKFQASGLQSALSDVSMATQEARALSRDIDAVLDAAAEMRAL